MSIIPAKLNKRKDKLVLIDQTLLPDEEKFLELDKAEDIREAIKKLRVRGAPAIGIAAAFGLYVCTLKSKATNVKDLKKEFAGVRDYLAGSRPTAVNLFWALNRMSRRFEQEEDKTVDEIKKALLEESEEIFKEDQAMGKAIGEHGRSEEHTSELQSRPHLVCRLLLEKKKKKKKQNVSEQQNKHKENRQKG